MNYTDRLYDQVDTLLIESKEKQDELETAADDLETLRGNLATVTRGWTYEEWQTFNAWRRERE